MVIESCEQVAFIRRKSVKYNSALQEEFNIQIKQTYYFNRVFLKVLRCETSIKIFIISKNFESHLSIILLTGH